MDGLLIYLYGVMSGLTLALAVLVFFYWELKDGDDGEG